MIKIATSHQDHWNRGVLQLEIILHNLNQLKELIQTKKYFAVETMIRNIIVPDLHLFLKLSGETIESFPYKNYSKYWTFEDFNTLYTNILALDYSETNNPKIAQLLGMKNRIENFYSNML